MCKINNFVLLFCAESQQGYHEERLINDIFYKRGYQKLARPVKNDSAGLEVNFGISLQQIIDVVSLGIDEGFVFL